MNETFFQTLQNSRLLKSAKTISLSNCQGGIDLSSATELDNLKIDNYQGCLIMPANITLNSVIFRNCDIANYLGIGAQCIILQNCTWHGIPISVEPAKRRNGRLVQEN